MVVSKLSCTLVEPAWLWYSFPEVQIRKETEIGLKSEKYKYLDIQNISFKSHN